MDFTSLSLSPTAGVTGVTFCVLIVGIISLAMIPYTHLLTDSASKLTSHVFWAQICTLIMAFSGLIFANLLEAVKRSRTGVELQIIERTSELAAARKVAEEADAAKANFIHFLW